MSVHVEAQMRTGFWRAIHGFMSERLRMGNPDNMTERASRGRRCFTAVGYVKHWKTSFPGINEGGEYDIRRQWETFWEQYSEVRIILASGEGRRRSRTSQH